MKTVNFALLIVMLTLGSAATAQNTEYFRVFAEVKSDPVFLKILEEARLDDVFKEKYQMVVNTGGKEPFIVIGAYNSPDVELDWNAYRYDWLFFSKPVTALALQFVSIFSCSYPFCI